MVANLFNFVKIKGGFRFRSVGGTPKYQQFIIFMYVFLCESPYLDGFGGDKFHKIEHEGVAYFELCCNKKCLSTRFNGFVTGIDGQSADND